MSTATPQPQDDPTATRPAVRSDPTARTPGLAGGSMDHREVLAREREEFGGMKFGSGFFGWLAATGMAVLLTAVVAAVGLALGMTPNLPAAGAPAGDARTMGIAGGITALVIVLVAYFCGGYVAGRMARFSGVKQGLAVWLWAIIMAVVVGVLAFVAGSQTNLLANLKGIPQLPSNGATTTAGIVSAVAVAAISLIGAILGGLAGMRFHRRVDRAGIGR